jgi:beta-glucosidase
VALLLTILTVAAPHARADVDPARISDLISRMTLAEKIGQLNLTSHAEPADGQIQAVQQGHIGAVLNVVDPKTVARFREAARTSRLGIPLLFGLDAVDAFRISFPPPIAWAATWRPELAEAAARQVAREAASVGINWTFAPMVDISRDPRWGRVIEGAGEDVLMNVRFASARTRGYLAGGLMPTAKHYVGYGAIEAGRDYNTALIPTSDLHDRHLPPFRAAIEAGAETVMASLNAINGVPATVNALLLDRILRQEMGFAGMVTSDYAAIAELVNHGVARDLPHAGRRALTAGIDMDMEGYAYVRHLAEDVAAGRVDVAAIDRAVARVLRLKMRMGLFEETPTPPMPPEAETRALARTVAEQSIVLLQNETDTLPIRADVRTVALIGAAAKSDFDDSWYGPALLTRPTAETLHDALKARLGPDQRLVYAPGFTDACGKTIFDVDGMLRTVAEADLVVAIVAEDCDFSGEATSRTNLDLSAAQTAVLDRIAATGKPLVLVVTAGRPLTLTRQVAQARAILMAWMPRTEGRTALADILTGAVVPSGKLPMTFPRTMGQIPISYDVLPTSRPPSASRYTSRYLDGEVTPLFPFGHGLSYTTFAYAALSTSAPNLPREGSLTVSVAVTNTGAREAEEVVQLYARQPVASRSRPVRQLQGFEKVRLAPGETRRVVFTLRPTAFTFHDDDGRPLIEAGTIELYAGGSSTATLSTSFQLE